MMKRIQQSGFTLLEILIALMILAIISAILVTGLRSVLNTKTAIENASSRLANLQIATSIISSDMRQITNRPVLDNQGVLTQPLILYSGGEQTLEFTRTGYANPLGQQQRSTLQRVTYRFHNGNLERGTWNVLDRAASSQPTYQTLLTDVTEVTWKFLGPQQTIYDEWPSSKVGANTPIPQAIELTLTINKWGTFHCWFIVEGYYQIIGPVTND